jgi:hypothetical protein
MADLSSYLAEVNRLGGVSKYMEANPEVYNPAYRWWSDPRYGISGGLQSYLGSRYMPTTTISPYDEIDAQINAYNALMLNFPGYGGTYIRKLISSKIDELRYERELLSEQMSGQLREKQAGIVRRLPGLDIRKVPREARERLDKTYTGTLEEAEAPEYIDMAVPDWMKPYLETSIKAGGTPETEAWASTLRPMGAQAELSPEQMGQMAGYLAWTKAGAPTEYSEEAIKQMADWQRWWEPYVRLSESLFPKTTRLGSRWTRALQR